MATLSFRSISWTLVRLGCLLAICIFLISTVPSKSERERLEAHQVVFQFDEFGSIVGVELTEATLYDRITDDISAIRTIKRVQLKRLECTDDLMIAVARLPNLRSLVCHDCDLTDRQLTLFDNLPLEYLDLTNTRGPIDGLAAFGRHDHLKSVILRGCLWLTDEGVRPLLSFPSMQNVDLSETSITDNAIAILSDCRSLTHLELSGCRKLSSAMLEHAQECRALADLRLREVPVLLSAAAKFAAIRPDVNLSYDQAIAPDLRALIVPDSGEDMAQSSGYSQEPKLSGKLERLSIAVHSPSDLHVLQYLPHLTDLRIAGEGIDDSAAAHISIMKELQGLKLTGAQISDSAFDRIPVLERLTDVRLLGSAVSPSALRWLARMPKLANLDLSESVIADVPETDEYTFSALGTLSLNNVQSEPTVLRHFNAPRLSSLQLKSCGLGDLDLSSLAAFSHLNILDLSENPIEGAGLILMQDLPVISLRLHGTKLTDVGLEAVGSLKHLASLDVSKTGISGTGFQTCSQLPIEYLCLNDCKLSKEGMETICRFPELHNLSFRRSQLPDDSLRMMSNRLWTITFEGNVDAIQAFAESESARNLNCIILINADAKEIELIQEFSGIRLIGLTGSTIDATAAELLVCLSNFGGLWLSECTISKEAMSILASSRTLEQIVLQNMDDAIDHEMQDIIDQDTRFYIQSSGSLPYSQERWY